MGAEPSSHLGQDRKVSVSYLDLRRKEKQVARAICTKNSIDFECKGCEHKFKFKDFRELHLYDYDMVADNGIQLKCPKCSQIVTFKEENKLIS